MSLGAVHSCLSVIGQTSEAMLDEVVASALAFYSWLYRIAVNMAISRKRRRRPTISVEQTRERTAAEPLSRDPRPDGRLIQQEQVDQVQAALSALSEEHRAVLVLREIDGCAYETIAEILELPVGTIRSRLHRARIQLKGQLQEVVEGELDD